MDERMHGFALASMFFYSTIVGAVEPIVVDTFAEPATPNSRTAFGVQFSGTNEAFYNDLGDSILGGIRGTMFTVYTNPLNSIAAVSTGAGRLSVAQGTGTMAETLVAYGAFTTPEPGVGGRRLNLDLSMYDGLLLEFSGAEEGMALGVTYYSDSPLNPGSPVYYAVNGLYSPVTVPGAPHSVFLSFDKEIHTGFNWSDVDGLILIINRSGPIPHTSYTLDKVTLVSR